MAVWQYPYDERQKRPPQPWLEGDDEPGMPPPVGGVPPAAGAAGPPPPVAPPAMTGNVSGGQYPYEQWKREQIVDRPAPVPGPVPPPPLAPSSPMTGDPVLNTMAPPPVAPIAPKAPPPVPGPSTEARDQYRELMRAGPKTSVLGTIAGGLVRGAAAWANSSNPSRPIAHVNDAKLEDWAKRSPTGGPWSEKAAQAKTLADLETGDEARAQARLKADVDLEHVRAQTKAEGQRGDYLGKEAANAEARTTIAGATEADRRRDHEMQRILQVGGKTPQVKHFPKDSPPPVGYDYVTQDPYDPNQMIAVRPHPGAEIDAETAAFLGLKAEADGSFHATGANINAGVRGWVKQQSDEAKRQQDEKKNSEHVREFNATLDEKKANTALSRRHVQDMDDAKAQGVRDRAQASIERYQKDEQDQHALRQAYGNATRVANGAAVIDPKSGRQELMSETLRAAYKQKLDAATTQVRRLQEAQRKLIERNGGGAAPAEPEPPEPAEPGAAAPPPVSRIPVGAQGFSPLPPAPSAGAPVAGAPPPPGPPRVQTSATVQAFATQNKITYEQALRIAQSQGYTIQ